MAPKTTFKIESIMAKFIEVADTGGALFLVNVDQIIYVKRELSTLAGKEAFKIDVPGASIWLTETMYNRVKSLNM